MGGLGLKDWFNIIYAEFEESVRQLAGCQLNPGTKRVNENFRIINIQ